MAAIQSAMKALGTTAEDFSLPDFNGNIVTLSKIQNKDAYLIVFMCNHCPYVKHIIKEFATLTQKWVTQNIAIIGINSNDFKAYPDDAPELMKEFAAKNNFTFPYLVDETQETAQAYQAACTPDFFLYNKKMKLVYRGQLDEARPGNEISVTGDDLSKAIQNVLAGTPVSEAQKPSIGCNIKWKPGHVPKH